MLGILKIVTGLLKIEAIYYYGSSFGCYLASGLLLTLLSSAATFNTAVFIELFSIIVDTSS